MKVEKGGCSEHGTFFTLFASETEVGQQTFVTRSLRRFDGTHRRRLICLEVAALH